MCVMRTCLRLQIHVITLIAFEFFSALEKEHNDYWLCKGFIYVKLKKIYQYFTFFVFNSTQKDKSFHCDVCNACLDKRLEEKHKCRPNSGHDECCVCLGVSEEPLFPLFATIKSGLISNFVPRVLSYPSLGTR